MPESDPDQTTDLALRELNETLRAQVADARRRLDMALIAGEVGTFVWDVLNDRLYGDRNFERLFSIPLDENGGAPLSSFLNAIHPDDREAVTARINRTLERGEDYEAIYRIIYGGRTRWVIARGKIERDADGRVTQFPGVLLDITDRKLAEDARKEITDRYEQQSRLFDAIATTTLDLIYVLDLEGRFLYANRRLLEVWGRTLQDSLGKNLYELGYPTWHADMHMRELREVIETKKTIKGEVPYTGASGIFGVYEYIFSPVLGPNGEVEVIAGTTRDVTDRKRAENALAAEKKVLEQIATGVPPKQVLETLIRGIEAQSRDGMLCSVLILDESGEHLLHGAAPSLPDEYNEAIHGVRIGPKVGSCGTAAFQKRAIDVFDISTDPLWADYAKLALTNGLAACCSTPILSSTGELLGTVAMYYRRKHEPSAHDRGLIETAAHLAGIVIERSEAERRVRQSLEAEQAARSDAERASRMKDEFLATLSHELRTPLGAIVGWSQILRTGTATPEDLEEGLAAIDRNARVQTQIIEDLLDMSRIGSGKIRLNLQQIDVAHVAQAAVDTMRPAAEVKGVQLEARVGDDVGTITGDPNRLHQVLWNLLSNAIKFTPKGGGVRVVVDRADEQVQIRVIDTGEGIRADFLPHVFDRFRQADASITRRHGGLGLGLAIVKQLVELHGGKVGASSPGLKQGTTFTVVLPVVAIADESESPNAAHENAGQHQLEGLRVLVVDDEADGRSVVKRFLEEAGATVQTAASAHEAIASMQLSMPDVLVSDIGMPGEDGYALMRRIRALGLSAGGNVPALALTAYARDEDRDRAVRAGFQMHITKPVQPAALIAKVATLAGRLRGVACPARAVGSPSVQRGASPAAK